MANKVIGFTVEIEGTKAAVENATDVKLAILEINKALKTTTDPKEVERLNKDLIKLNGTLQNLNEEQRQAQKEFAARQFGAGSIKQLKAELKGLEIQYERLGKTEREAARGKALEEQIAGIRKEIRATKKARGSAGLLESILGDNLQKQLPILKSIKDEVKGIGSAAGSAGKLLTAGFAAFSIGSEIASAIGAAGEFIDQFSELRRQTAVSFQATGTELDELTAKISAQAKTFEVDTQEAFTAANAVVQTFGTDAAGAIDLIDKALLGVRDRQKFLGDLTSDVEKLAGLGISDESAIGLIAQASNLDFNVDVFTKPLAALREQSEATQDALVSAFGEETTKEIFAAFEREPLEAIQKVSAEFNKLDSKSIESAAVLKDVFRVSRSGEDLATIQSLANISTSLDGLTEAAGAAAQRELALLEANKELAAAQNEVTKRFEDSAASFEVVGTNIQTFFLDVLIRLLDIFQPVLSAFSRLGSAFVGLGEKLGIFNAAGGESVSLIDFLTGGLQALADITTFAVDAFTFLVNGLTDFVSEIPFVSGAINLISKAFNAVITVVNNLPALFEAVGASARQLGTNIGAFFERIALNAQLLFLNIQEFNPLGPIQEDLDRQRAALTASFERLSAESRTIGEAFSQTFAEAVERRRLAREGAAAEEEKATQEQEQKRAAQAQKRVSREKKLTNDLEKEEKKRAAQAKKEQDKLLKETEKLNVARASLIQQLSKNLIELEISNIKDAQAAALAAEEQRFKQAQQQRAEQFAQLVKDTEEQEAKIVAAFGENSQQVLQFREKAAFDLREIEQQYNQLEVQDFTAHQAALLEIEQQGQEERQQQRIQSLNDSLQAIENAFTQEQLFTEELRARGLVSEEEAAKRQVQARTKAIAEELAALEAQEIALDEAITIGVDVDTTEFEEVILKRQQLNTELAQLEEEQTRKVEEEAAKRKDSLISGINEIGGFVTQSISIIDQFASAESEKTIARLELEKEASQQRAEDIEKELEGTSGLERRFLEQKLQREKAAGEEITKRQEEENKARAEQQKAVAITQAIINGALAVTNILATLIDPTPVQGFKIAAIALAVATTAAQIATISAQQFADGGEVGSIAPSDIGAGLVTARQNIRTQPNGDNVLATIARGEVVLNKKQQAAAGGAPFFKSLGVKGFAEGGVVGAPLTAPSVVSSLGRSTQDTNTKFTDFAEAVNRRADALERTVLKMKVILLTDELEADQNERQQIQKRATLE
jgi:hypothetical protein